ncbi:SDR family NAD(P)-dependent oxidoreductase [Vannielia litorea]|uniref:7-alpha-hydroxysteroid dehydrogenase n=1 Tax=Vannielia litorea TaxID=1217970 RepID=A0A1N6H8I7_9RHOB|nr:SDR family oxidoreductase [Vannielia litorea]SIO16029.1 7-alpha-hydroxysteroid dehydrogenase [Vannielia litorea]
MSFSIKGKTCIVTGASHGLGLAIARHFAARGANVMAADTDDKKLAEAFAADAEAEDSRLRYFAGNLRERLAQANLLSATIDAFERVDVLVNAYRMVLPSVPGEPDEDAVEELLQHNLLTALRMTQLVAKRFAKQAEDDEGEGDVGCVINMSSIAARRTHPRMLAYSVSTAALDQMTRSMAVALAPERIRVNAVSFGSVLTTSLNRAVNENEGYREDIIGHTPMGRIAQPNEVAEVVQFLASESAGFITGQIVTMDGGRTLLDPVGAPAH